MKKAFVGPKINNHIYYHQDSGTGQWPRTLRCWHRLVTPDKTEPRQDRWCHSSVTPYKPRESYRSHHNTLLSASKAKDAFRWRWLTVFGFILAPSDTNTPCTAHTVSSLPTECIFLWISFHLPLPLFLSRPPPLSGLPSPFTSLKQPTYAFTCIFISYYIGKARTDIY